MSFAYPIFVIMFSYPKSDHAHRPGDRISRVEDVASNPTTFSPQHCIYYCYPSSLCISLDCLILFFDVILSLVSIVLVIVVIIDW